MSRIEYPASTRTIGWALAIALVVTGAFALYQGLFPLKMGDAEWEVGAVGQAVAGAAAGALGWAAMTWLALTSSRLQWLARVIGFVGVALAVAAGFGALLVATNIPLVWNAAQSTGSVVRAAAYKSIAVKAAVLSGLYSLFFLGFSAKTLHTSFTRK